MTLSETNAPAEAASLGELFSTLTSDLSALVHDEIELAKVEITADVKEVGKSGGLLGGAALAGYMAVLLGSFALAWGLAELMAEGLAFLIVTVIWGGVGAALFVTGRKKMQAASLKPEQTVQTLKEDVTWAKNLKH